MDEAVAAIAAHLGIVDEEQINNMSLNFFHSVLSALGKKLNFESISNLYGNSFAKDASKYVSEANPLYKAPKVGKAFASILNQASVVKFNADNVKETFGDVSWAEGLFGDMSQETLANIAASQK